MDGQMLLIDERPGTPGADDYHLDDHTRDVGRRAVEAARDILRQAQPKVERPAWDRRHAA
ncbi:MAG TPA: hypothetical protein VHN98_12990 [Acidimicrobiales bacterium]|nr:hypothetical protein [Acidimicrobiales bacterium]